MKGNNYILKAIIFDMDDTLYSNQKLKDAYRQAAYYLIKKQKKISEESAVKMFQDAYDTMAYKSKYTPINSTILEHLGFKWETWAQHSIDNVDPRMFLKKDLKLIDTLTCLKKKFKLGILTNNSRTQTDRVLEKLEIVDLFDVILTVSELGAKKPDSKLCQQIAAALKCLPTECLMVGDNLGVDLLPAEAIKMRTRLIGHINEIYELVELLK